MALKTGTPAPDFTLKSKQSDGLHEVTLSAQRGHKNVVLLFFPLAFSSGCTKELCTVSQGLADYSGLDAVVYGISVDSVFAQAAFAHAEGIHLMLLSDFNKQVATAYDVVHEVFAPGKLDYRGVAKRSAFVVNKEGIISYAWSSDDPSQQPPFGELQAVLGK